MTLPAGPPVSRAQILRVPDDAPTLGAAIEASADGDTILVSPGTRKEAVILNGKQLVIGSLFLTTEDTSYIGKTIIDGGGAAAVIFVDSTQTVQTALIGLTIQNGDDCIYANGRLRLLHVRITGCKDGVDYETGSGGSIRHSVFFDNLDDGIDLDEDVDVLIENNLVHGNGNDGIEIRLHPYTGPTLEYVIRDNVISSNTADGIQLIGYPGVSDRRFRIERNVIRDNGQAGVGCMSGGESKETYEAADLPEQIELVNNTFEGNDRDVSCSGL